MKFFFDECISHLIVKALCCLEHTDKPGFAAKHEIVHLFDRYPDRSTPILDTQWIPEVAQDGFVIITADHAQKKNRGKHEAESRAYRDENAIAFWLPKTFVQSTHGKWEQASRFFLWWPKIVRVAGTARPCDLFDISEKGDPIARK